jgi:hypothetical protein
MKKKVLAYFQGSGYSVDKLRRSMMEHQHNSPDCSQCEELGVDWATVEIEERPMESGYPTYAVVDEADREDA